MRILITGANGRLGGALCRLGRAAGHTVLPFSRLEADLADLDRLAGRVAAEDFDALIHPAAMTSLEACEADPEAADRVNGESPAVLAALCRARGAACIHISTDYVFSGGEEGLRAEDEPPGPVNAYGRSKRAGEEAVLAADPRFWVARVAWLYGRERPAFVETILERARSEERVTAIADKFSNPSWCDDTAGALLDLLAVDGGGVVHAVNRGAASWWSYASEVLALARRHGIPLRAREVEPASLDSMASFVARRPVHTALSTERIEGLLGRPMRAWQEALAAYFRAPGGPVQRIA